MMLPIALAEVDEIEIPVRGTAEAMAFFSRHVPIIPPPDLDRRRIRATGARTADQRIRTRSLEPQVSPESRVLEPDRTLLADEEQVLARG